MHSGPENVLQYVLALVAGLACGKGGDLFIKDAESEERGKFYRVMQVLSQYAT